MARRLGTALSRLYWRLRRRMLRIAFAARQPNCVRMPNGRTLYLDCTDARSFALWETSGNVNRRSIALWQAIMRLYPWSLILAVGANHGEMPLWSELPRAWVYAIEPNLALAALLRRSLADSHIAAEVVEAAVGSHRRAYRAAHRPSLVRRWAAACWSRSTWRAWRRRCCRACDPCCPAGTGWRSWRRFIAFPLIPSLVDSDLFAVSETWYGALGWRAAAREPKPRHHGSRSTS